MLSANTLVCVNLHLNNNPHDFTGKKRNGHSSFDRGDIFNRRKGDAAGFAPLTSHEDTYTEDESDEHELETRKILPKH